MLRFTLHSQRLLCKYGYIGYEYGSDVDDLFGVGGGSLYLFHGGVVIDRGNVLGDYILWSYARDLD